MCYWLLVNWFWGGALCGMTKWQVLPDHRIITATLWGWLPSPVLVQCTSTEPSPCRWQRCPLHPLIHVTLFIWALSRWKTPLARQLWVRVTRAFNHCRQGFLLSVGLAGHGRAPQGRHPQYIFNVMVNKRETRWGPVSRHGLERAGERGDGQAAY